MTTSFLGLSKTIVCEDGETNTGISAFTEIKKVLNEIDNEDVVTSESSQATADMEATPPILNLPNEILCEIFAFVLEPDLAVDYGDNAWDRLVPIQKAIPNLKLVNHQFKDIASLFRDRYWTDLSPRKYERRFGPLDFAIRLLRNPELRRRVRHVEFYTCMCKFAQAVKKRPLKYRSLPQDDLHDLAYAADQLHFPAPDEKFQVRWVDELRNGTVESCPALIAEWATNLESLAITMPIMPANPPSNTLLRWLQNKFDPKEPGKLFSATGAMPLAKLRSVYLRRWEKDFWFSYEEVAPFFYLPSMRVLYAQRIGAGNHLNFRTEEDSASIPLGDMSPEVLAESKIGAMSNIEELHLVGTDPSARGLHDMVSHCRKLKILKYHHAGSVRESLRREQTWAYLLSMHEEHLEELVLDFSVYKPRGSLAYSEWHEPIEIGLDFSQLRCLRKLLVNEWLLSPRGAPPCTIEVERLQATLETLTVVDSQRLTTWSLYPAHAMIAGGPTKVLSECGPGRRLPNLKTLDLTMIIREDCDHKAIASLENEAYNRGIELKLGPRLTRNRR